MFIICEIESLERKINMQLASKYTDIEFQNYISTFI